MEETQLEDDGDKNKSDSQSTVDTETHSRGDDIWKRRLRRGEEMIMRLRQKKRWTNSAHESETEFVRFETHTDTRMIPLVFFVVFFRKFNLMIFFCSRLSVRVVRRFDCLLDFGSS